MPLARILSCVDFDGAPHEIEVHETPSPNVSGVASVATEYWADAGICDVVSTVPLVLEIRSSGVQLVDPATIPDGD